MAWILDGAVLVLLAVMILIGHKRGAIRSVIEFAGVIAALLSAALLGGWLSEWIYTTFMRGGLLTKFEQVITESVGGSAADRVEAIASALPAYVGRFLDGQSLAEQIRAADDAGAVNGAQILVDDVVGPILLMILRTITTVVLFIVVLILFKLIARAGDLVAKLPVLHQLNQALGAVCGAAKAALLILLAAAALRAASPLIPTNAAFGSENISESIVFKWVYDHNPLYDFFAPDQAAEQ